MEVLKKKILEDGTIENGNILKVDNFLNHQLDVEILNHIGKEIYERFKGDKIEKILTIETSGIAIAVIAAQYFNVPVVFARKIVNKVMDTNVYEAEVYSYTKDKNYTIRVSKNYLKEDENILIIDDFLAKGQALQGLIELVSLSGGNVSGLSVVIEKGFQDGGDAIRELGYKLESLAIIDEPENGQIKFM